jgi:hypothetical protein
VAEQRCNTEDADSAIIVNFPWYGNNQLLLNELSIIESNILVGNANVRTTGRIVERN